jgi:hypothetical protein
MIETYGATRLHVTTYYVHLFVSNSAPTFRYKFIAFSATERNRWGRGLLMAGAKWKKRLFRIRGVIAIVKF